MSVRYCTEEQGLRFLKHLGVGNLEKAEQTIFREEWNKKLQMTGINQIHAVRNIYVERILDTLFLP